MLRRGQPFLLGRLYEHPAADKNQDQPLITGIHACFLPECSQNSSPVDASLSSVALESAVPGRPQIRLLSESSEQTSRQTAFKLMASVINFDLSSEPTERRTVQDFDEDWQLFLHVAEKNLLSA